MSGFHLYLLTSRGAECEVKNPFDYPDSDEKTTEQLEQDKQAVKRVRQHEQPDSNPQQTAQHEVHPPIGDGPAKSDGLNQADDAPEQEQDADKNWEQARQHFGEEKDDHSDQDIDDSHKETWREAVSFMTQPLNDGNETDDGKISGDQIDNRIKKDAWV